MGILSKIFGSKKPIEGTNKQQNRNVDVSTNKNNRCSKCGFSLENCSCRSNDSSSTNKSTQQPKTDIPVGMDISNYRLVMALSQAVQQKFKNYPTDMTAAIFLAMTEKNKNDIVVRQEGIYISRQCQEMLLSYEIWLAVDGQIIITRKRHTKKYDEPKVDSQTILQRQLPKARKLGKMNPLHYTIGVSLTFGLDQDKIIIDKNKNTVAVYG